MGDEKSPQVPPAPAPVPYSKFDEIMSLHDRIAKYNRILNKFAKYLKIPLLNLGLQIIDAIGSERSIT